VDKYLKSPDIDWYRQRIVGVMVCVLVAFAGLFLRLIYLQVIMGEEYRRLSLNNSIRLQSIDAPRGLIYDSSGRVLAENRPSFDVSVILKDAGNPEKTIEALSTKIGLPAEELMSKFDGNRRLSPYRPVLLAQDIGRNALAALEVHRFELPGVGVDVKLRRHYLNDTSATHLVGYLGEISLEELKGSDYPGCRSGDFVGKFGVEKTFENVLRGKRGGRQVEVNANGQIVRILETVPAEPGQNVYLTLDRDLQLKAESLLEGDAGAAVVVETSTGRVLALASSPGFQQSAFINGMTHTEWESLISNPLRPLENKAIQGEYAPGSTYKIITALAGLQEGVIDENTILECPGSYRFGNRTYRCWKRWGHGKLSVVRALAESCDVFFYQVGLKLGVDRLAWYAKAAGLGSPTGIALQQEARGLVPTAAWKKRRTGIPWQEGETLSVAIGQGFDLATPLQMAMLTAAVANGGTRYQPLILDSIRSADGKLLTRSQPVITGKLPISRKNLDIVRRGLREVVRNEHGTAHRIDLKDLQISGKTGTSQVFSRKGDESIAEDDIADNLKSHAWFVAYAPSDKPQIAVAVMVEHGEHGAAAAAPIAQELIKAYLLKDVPDRLLEADRDGVAQTQGAETQ
jgi:penicillin-binding protein 2